MKQKIERLLPFILYTSWVSAAYFVLALSIRLVSRVSFQQADKFLIMYPIVVAFFLLLFDWEKKIHKVHHVMMALVLSGIAAIGCIVSMVALWVQYDSLFLIPYHLFFVMFAVSSFLLFFPHDFLKKRKYELSFFALLYVVGVAILFLLQYFWTYVSYAILKVLDFFTDLFYVPVKVLPYSGVFNYEGFQVAVGLPCIGITSFLLFVSFYGGYGVLQWSRKNLHTLNYYILFVAGFVLLFGLNVLRIWAISFIGAKYSPEFAIYVFHNFAGFGLFIAFMVPYYYLVRNRIVLRHKKN